MSSSNQSLFGQFREGISLAHRGTGGRASTGSQAGSGKELSRKQGDRVYCGAVLEAELMGEGPRLYEVGEVYLQLSFSAPLATLNNATSNIAMSASV